MKKMTALQTATFVTSQCMMMQAELALLMAHSYAQGRPPDAGKVATLLARYEPVLRHDAVVKLFEEATEDNG